MLLRNTPVHAVVAAGEALHCFVPAEPPDDSALRPSLSTDSLLLPATAPLGPAADGTLTGEAKQQQQQQQQQLQNGMFAPSGFDLGFSSGFASASDRGCSSGRGWQEFGALPTTQQLGALRFSGATMNAALGPFANAAAAAAASGLPCVTPGVTSSVTSAATSGATLGLSAPLGYTSMAVHEQGSDATQLLAGTADGRVCVLDATTGRLTSEMLVTPVVHAPVFEPSAAVVSALCSGRGWVAAASGQGHVMLVDERCGLVLASWRAHGGHVTALQAVPGRAPQLLSCSSGDRSLKVWDLRMSSRGQSGAGAYHHAGVAQQPRPLFRAPAASAAQSDVAWGRGGVRCSSPGLIAWHRSAREGIDGFAVHQDAVIAFGGPLIGVASLSGSSSGGGGSGGGGSGGGGSSGGGARRSSGSGMSGGVDGGVVAQVLPMTAVRGPRGARDAGAAIVGLGLLPLSRLLVVGSEDGQLRICR